MQSGSKAHSLKYNAIINILSKVMSIIFPVITIPYVTRTLDVGNYGMVSLSQNIIGFFALFAGLGISTYATRTGAAIRDDPGKLKQFACEVFSINVLSTLSSLLGLAACVFIFPELHPLLSLLTVMSMGIMMGTIGCDWVNNIYEDFTSLTVRTFFVQIISLALLFLLVKNADDQLIYASIGVFASGFASLINAVYIRRYVKISFVRCSWSLIKHHVKPILIFFFTQVACMIYVSSDSVMLGFMQNNEEVAFYNIATKVYTIVNTMIYAVIMVLLPRLSNTIHVKKDLLQNCDKIDQIFNVMLLLTVPCMALVFSLSDSIVLFLGGITYGESVVPLKLLSFASLFSVFAGLYSACILLPVGAERISFYCTVLAAVVNLVANVIFIPIGGATAAAATTVLAEAVGFLGYWLYCRRLLHIRISRNVLAVVVMGYILTEMVCRSVHILMKQPFFHCIVSGIAVLFVYSLVLYLGDRKDFFYLYGGGISKITAKMPFNKKETR